MAHFILELNRFSQATHKELRCKTQKSLAACFTFTNSVRSADKEISHNALIEVLSKMPWLKYRPKCPILCFASRLLVRQLIQSHWLCITILKLKHLYCCPADVLWLKQVAYKHKTKVTYTRVDGYGALVLPQPLDGVSWQQHEQGCSSNLGKGWR